MTLVTRLSLFLLAALGVVLLGFSAALYALAHVHLHRQADERAAGMLDVLTAAVESEPEGLEWNRPDLAAATTGARIDAAVLWRVVDGDREFVDGSHDQGFASACLPAAAGATVHQTMTWEGRVWGVSRRTLQAGVGSPDKNPQSNIGIAAPEHKHRELTLAVAVPLTPVHGTLRTLAFGLAGISLSVWLVAAVTGRWMCRRALAPITQMAQITRSISANDLTLRLPSPGTRDELEDLGSAFNDLLARIQDAFSRQERFTAEASHQLRTPLTSMLGQLEVALRRDRPPEEYQRALIEFQRQALHLQDIVDALVFLARADADAELPGFVPMDIADWLRMHVQKWREHPRHDDIRLAIETNGAAWVRAHAGLLGQAVDNLIDNACKYSASGSPIIARLQRDAGNIILSIEDCGYGIGREEQSHLFEPFFRSTNARQRGISGIGLGLSVTKRIITAFSGRINALSELGNGSQFVIEIPESSAPHAE